MRIINNNRGFTFVEVLIVLAIIVIISALTSTAFVKMRDRQTLRSATQDVFSTLLNAKNKTLGSKDDTIYGVRINTDSVAFFKSGTFSSSSPDTVIQNFSQNIRATTTLPGGTQDIIFQRLTGEPNISGTITLIEQNSNASNTIIIYESGLIEI